MAERRMIAKTIIDSDAFLDMGATAQLLYFHFACRADDDGFINKPKSIMRQIGATQGDIEMLINKKFIIPFDSGVVVIKHWRIHNYISKDRYHETKYKEEKASLFLDENNAYTQHCRQSVDNMYTDCRQSVHKMETQVRLGKDSIGKDRLDKVSIESNSCCINNNKRAELFVEYFGRELNGKELEIMNSIYCEDDELFEKAFDIAVKNNRMNLGYISGIFANWQKEGIKTMNDYIDRDIELNGI